MPRSTPVEETVSAPPVAVLSVDDLVAAVKAVQPEPVATAPQLSPEVIAAALGMTVDELNVVRSAAIKRQERTKKYEDEPLETPVRFWCDRYKTLRFLVNGKRRKFVNGQFLATTRNELAAVRNLTQKDFIFEGDDMPSGKPIRCRVCRAEFRNSEAFQDHMSRHVIA